MTIWFLSDPHFGHAKMLTFTYRPNRCQWDEQQCDAECKANHEEKLVRPGFASVEEMDELIIQRWNERVRPSDHGYILGDIAIARRNLKTALRLNGHLRAVLGNHDVYEYKEYVAAGFKKIMGVRVMDNILFTHIPVHPLNMGRFLGNAHGHIHQNVAPEGPYVNLSVEALDYTPITLEEVRKRIEARRR